MHLFNGGNILPKDGEALYYGPVFSRNEADFYFQYLLEGMPWENDVAVLFGKRIETRRKVAWFGDRDFEYTYSNNSKYALPWTKQLLTLKERVEYLSEESYNSCLLNLYHDGSEGMAWHSDGEPDLKENGAIASVTFGAERNFAFKHKGSKERLSLPLAHGSLLVMKGPTQKYWLHRLPPTKKLKGPRINLTFRTICERT